MFFEKTEKKYIAGALATACETIICTQSTIEPRDAALQGTETSFLFAGGAGTKEDPYRIETETQLRAFAVSLTKDLNYGGIHIQLENDILLGEEDWIPIGKGEYGFNGFFDGQNYAIRGLKIGMPTAYYVDSVGKHACVYFGLFGVLDADAQVQNLNLAVEIYVTSGQSLYVSGLAGYISQALVENVHISGVIAGRTTHRNANIFVGGVCGSSYRQRIAYSSSSAYVRAESVAGMAEAGGIVGMQNRGIICHCYTNGSITGTAEFGDKGGPCLGGIAGVHAGSIVQCCSTAEVVADCNANYLGALVGWATGISDTVESYYCFSARLIRDNETEQRQEIRPAIAIGWSVGRGVNGLGETYTGSITLNVQGFEDEKTVWEMQKNRYHETLLPGYC